MNAIHQDLPTRRQILTIGGAIAGGAAVSATLGACSSFVGGSDESNPASTADLNTPRHG